MSGRRGLSTNRRARPAGLPGVAEAGNLLVWFKDFFMPGARLDLFACRLSICGISELPQFAEAGVSHVLSIIDPLAEDPPVFASFAAHDRALLRFDDVISEWQGYTAPQHGHVQQVLDFYWRLCAVAGGPSHLLVHCHAGLSRSTAATAILLAQHAPGREEAAFDRLFEVRPRAWPNSRMVAMADSLLKRDGALVAALKRHQRGIIDRHPDIAELVSSVGRGHELPR